MSNITMNTLKSKSCIVQECLSHAEWNRSKLILMLALANKYGLNAMIAKNFKNTDENIRKITYFFVIRLTIHHQGDVSYVTEV